jgi:hypothetical protein
VISHQQFEAAAIVGSAARAKGSIGGLDFNFTLALGACGEPERAACSLNYRAAGPFVWIIHKLVEPNLRRVPNAQVALTPTSKPTESAHSPILNLCSLIAALRCEATKLIANRITLPLLLHGKRYLSTPLSPGTVVAGLVADLQHSG